MTASETAETNGERVCHRRYREQRLVRIAEPSFPTRAGINSDRNKNNKNAERAAGTAKSPRSRRASYVITSLFSGVLRFSAGGQVELDRRVRQPVVYASNEEYAAFFFAFLFSLASFVSLLFLLFLPLA